MTDELRSEGWGYTHKTTTPSQQCIAAGLPSLAVVSKLTGVSRQTLTNWHKHKPKLFRVVLSGCQSLSKPTED